MEIRVNNMSDRDRRILYQTQLPQYLDGKCYAFAIALHEGLGWKTVGLMDGPIIRHAAVRNPEGQLYDIRGIITEEDFCAPFNLTSIEIADVAVSDLVREGESEESRMTAVAQARNFAEVVFPDLPWKNTMADRMAAYIAGLQELSREHGIWIRASLPSCMPILTVADDECRYEIFQDRNGLSFRFDRLFVQSQ